jgi:hypothetical protein
MATRLSPAVHSRLRYVRASCGVDLSDFPDFLVVGPQRTGTTWLHANLREHPEVMLSEPKEIFFFSRLRPPDQPNFQSSELDWYLKFFREPWWRRALKTARCLQRYGCRYRPKVKGEATASYAALPADVIDEVVLLRPEIKVILSVRDPIERAWSHAKKDLARQEGRRIDQVDESEILRFFGDEYQLRCAQYARNFENWSSRLRPGHLFVVLFEDIARRPLDLLLDVMSFLGVARDARFVGRQVERAVNPTSGDTIPEKYRAALVELLGAERDRLYATAALRSSGIR